MEITRRVYLLLLSMVALWCGLIVVAPLIAGVSESAGSLVYQFFSRICHQLDERSFHIAGGKFAVCIRCSAIYFAFFAGLALYPFIKHFDNRALPSRRWLLLALLPMLVDVFLGLTGIHNSTDMTRLITGSLFGIALPWYILPVLFESLASLSKSSSKSSNRTLKGEPLYARKTE